MGDAGQNVVFFICLWCFWLGSVSQVCRLVFNHWGAATLSSPSSSTSMLSAACSSHPSAEDTVGDKPRHSAAGWGIDLLPHSSHRSASLSLTWRHAARLLLLLIVYMAPPVGQCIISTTYLQSGTTAASGEETFIISGLQVQEHLDDLHQGCRPGMCKGISFMKLKINHRNS